ncbi:hypothetical protein BGZ60DRAFT_157056 [Tricladium varicosporioides]|nr:hypothetical protein BGZ60DRAFT_157056 [Hymenoscyphus varicosporioides]
MTFPSRGCRTCKKRRVKCDEARPVCERCRKANIECTHDESTNKFIFLSENEYAVGQRKRPRGPNVKPGSNIQPHFLASLSPNEHQITPIQNSQLFEEPDNIQLPLVSRGLEIPLDDQAFTYYWRNYVEVPPGFPEIVDGHMCAIASSYKTQGQTVLSLAVSAVSHATFGRSQKSSAVVAASNTKYAKALLRTNAALTDPVEALSDEVLLAVMLLSFYENSVMDKASNNLGRGLQVMASRSFTHHDGAMAMLNFRRQQNYRSARNVGLDKLVRRQLIRSLLLRSQPLPPWLRNGAQFGESGVALNFDKCMVVGAKLRHQASKVLHDTTFSPISQAYDEVTKLHDLFAETKALDSLMAIWEKSLPMEDRYSVHKIQQSRVDETAQRIFDVENVHIYPTVGHAGMWNRYRTLRIAINDIMVKVLAKIGGPEPTNVLFRGDCIKVRIEHLTEDLCASIPYMLGLIETRYVPLGGDMAAFIKPPTSPKETASATIASLLCWPLAMTTMIPSIPQRHRKYLKARLLEVSEIVDDGVLETLASASLDE